MNEAQIHLPPTTMAIYKVIEVINANTIRVSPKWNFGNDTGEEVQIDGLEPSNYRLPAQLADIIFKQRLNQLIAQRMVELSSPAEVVIPGQKIKCAVFLNGTNVTKYFPELTKK